MKEVLAEIADYVDMADPMFESAEAQVRSDFITEQEGRGISIDKIADMLQETDVQIRLESRKLDHMASVTAVEYRNLTRLCIEVIYRCAKIEAWMYCDDEFSSLHEWALNRLRIMGSDDYIARFVRAAENMLIPIDAMGIIGDDGEVITGLDIVRKAEIKAIKERAYTFEHADFEQQVQLAKFMVQRKTEDIAKLHKAVMNPTEEEIQQDPKKAEVANRPHIKMRVEDVDGGWKVTITEPLTEAQLHWLEGVLGDQLEVEFA